MLFHGIHLDDRMTIDSHICNGSGTNTAGSSLYETKTAKMNDEKKNKGTITKQKNISYYYVNHVFGVLPLCI